jgi:PKD repeat protein
MRKPQFNIVTIIGCIVLFIFTGIGLPVSATPIANFNFVDNYRSVQFTDTSVGSPNCWQWDFGDGSTSNVQNPTHTYSANGHYTIKLDVGTNGQFLSSTTQTVAARELLTASFTVSPTSGIAPVTVQLTDTSTGNPNYWTWQGGCIVGESHERNPSCVLTTPGKYGFVLEVDDTDYGIGSTRNSGDNGMFVTVASPYMGTTTTTSPLTTTSQVSTTVTTAVPTSTQTTVTTIPTTTISTTATITTATTTAPITTVTTVKSTTTATTVQTTAPTTIETTLPITPVSTPTIKPTKKATTEPTPWPTDTPTQQSPLGSEIAIISIIGAPLLVMKRK